MTIAQQAVGEAERARGTKFAKDEAPAAAAPAAEAADLEVSEDPTAAGPYGAGSVEANEDGSAPEGYTIKGNTNSMKYHEPDGQWFDQTVAEVWFDSTEAAEAAGFTKAGDTESDES